MACSRHVQALVLSLQMVVLHGELFMLKNFLKPGRFFAFVVKIFCIFQIFT